MLRFLHCADAHLDTPFTMEDLEQADVRRAELRNAFSSMMLYIRQNGVRLLLIAGDLFSHAFLTKETTALLRREFASVPDCHIIIAPGSHDFFAEDSVYQTTAFSENVHIFPCFEHSFELPEKNTVIWGKSYSSPCISPSFTSHSLSEENINIMCLHGDTLRGSDYNIISQKTCLLSPAIMPHSDIYTMEKFLAQAR